VLAEYTGYTIETLMEVPIKQFWFIANMIERIRAEKDLRHIQLLASVGSVEGYTAARDFLKEQAGEIYVMEGPTAPVQFKIDPQTGLDPEFDREGLRALKMKISAGR
jgi:hypothetical protein